MAFGVERKVKERRRRRRRKDAKMQGVKRKRDETGKGKRVQEGMLEVNTREGTEAAYR